ncbi:MAG: lysophospholipid acyltransferase family protein [Polyangiaceae bacterium]|jgi:1-acyl-sn-glycerol-3-phosphate acyltransferase|nr:lysophospholipid acyltransferase family protein [Polyangiaceae bacterium]
MIPAAKSPLFEAWFLRHVRGRLRGAFSSLRVAGSEHVIEAASRAPLLWVGNHTSWWDPLVAYHLSGSLFRLDGHAMMDASNLRRLPFFARIGAFGVDLDDPADGARSLRYAARLLDAPRRMVLVFPQGTERPITERPLRFKPGSGELSRLAPRCRVIPFAVRYDLAGEELPRILVRFGPPIEMPRGREARAPERLRANHEEAVTALLDAIDRDVCSDNLEPYVPQFTSKPGAGELAGRALGWLVGPRLPPHLSPRLPP